MNRQLRAPSTRNVRSARAHLSSLLVLTGLLAGSSHAQLPEDMGPEPVGERSVSFSHPLSANSTVTADIFYPALSSGQNATPNVAGGPYPLVVFLHGYFAPPSFYSILTAHMASYGFVVAAVGTEAGFFQNIMNEARDAHALLHWVDEQGSNPTSFLWGMPSDGPWSATGHSNGVAAIFYMLEWEDRIDYVAATEANWFNIPTVSQFDGSFLSIGSSEDLLAPASTNARRYYLEAQSAQRRTYALILGGGHNGSLDFPSSLHTLSHAEQNRLHRRLMSGFLRAEVLGEENVYSYLIGADVQGEPISRETNCPRPILWAEHDGGQPGAVNAGMAAVPGDTISLAWSRGDGLQALGLGLAGLSGSIYHTAVVPASGVLEVPANLPPEFSGSTLTVRGVRDSGSSWAYTRAARIQVP